VNLISNSDKKRLIANFFSLSVLQGADYILPLITFPYLVRVLGVGNFGLLAFATATIAYFKFLTDYGFDLTATREISIYRENKEKVIEIFSSVIIIKFVLMIVSFLFLIVLVCSFEKFSKDAHVYFLTFGTVIGQTLFPVWFFQGMEKMKYLTFLNILSKTIFTFAIFIFVQDQNDYYRVPLLNSIGFMIAGFFSIIIIKKNFGVFFKFQSFLTIKKYFLSGWNVFIINFLPSVYINFSTMFLGFFASTETVGLYALSTKIVEILNKFIYVIRNVTYPYFAKNLKNFSKISKVTVIIGALFSLGVITLSHWLIPFVFGNQMVKSLPYLYMISLSPLFLAVTVVYGSNKLLVYKKDKIMRNITIQYSLFGLIFALLIIPVLNAYGSALVLVSTRALMAYLTYKEGKDL